MIQMRQKLKHSLKYLSYLLKSKHYNGHGIHSPFIYDFSRKVLFSGTKKKSFFHVKKYRKQLKRIKHVIDLEDFGAGSKLSAKSTRKVSEIAAASSTKRKYGKLLAKIIMYYRPQIILELGTSLGIGTLYLSTFMQKKAQLFTIEGDKNLSQIANNSISKISEKNIKFLNTTFKNAIPQLINQVECFDFVFFDGHHSESATIEYFKQCLSNINEQSIFVFDDIHWSKGMENAWQYIINHDKTKVCIDIFQFGIVFFKKGLTKQNYMIRF